MNWPPQERPSDTRFAEMFIDGAMMLAREGARVTKLYLPTRDFLWLAYQCNAHDENAGLRSVLRPIWEGRADPFLANLSPEPNRNPVVRVGDRFNMAAPWGMVEIIEDKEA